VTELVRAAYDHCAEVTRREAKNFYYAFLLLPRTQRRAMYALYAFCRVADDIVDEPGEEVAKRAGLAELRARLVACWDGRPEGPMFTALADARERFGLDARHLVDVVDGCEMDLDVARYETWDDLCIYLDRVATAVGRATMQVLGLDPERLAAYALAGGRSVQLTNIVRDVREDAERGRVYLPMEELRAAGVREGDLLADRSGDALKRLVARQVERTRGLYARSRETTTPGERRRLLPLTAICRIYERVLDDIEARDHDVLAARASIPGWKKACIGLDTWLRARLGLPIGR
jgi:phytoene synthase